MVLTISILERTPSGVCEVKAEGEMRRRVVVPHLQDAVLEAQRWLDDLITYDGEGVDQ